MSINAINLRIIEIYATRFRRNLNSITKALNRPASNLDHVVVKSKATGRPLAIAIAAYRYEEKLCLHTGSV